MNIGAAVLFDNEHFVFLFTNPLNTESAMKMHMAHVNRFSFNPAGETWYLICSCQPAAPRFSDHQPVNGICCLGHSCILPVAFGRARSCIKQDLGGPFAAMSPGWPMDLGLLTRSDDWRSMVDVYVSCLGTNRTNIIEQK